MNEPSTKPPGRPRPSRTRMRTGDAGDIGDVARPLTFIERAINNAGAQRLLVMVVLAVTWEIYARCLDNPLLFPTFTETLRRSGMTSHGVLIDRTITSLRRWPWAMRSDCRWPALHHLRGVERIGTAFCRRSPPCSIRCRRSRCCRWRCCGSGSDAIARVRHRAFGVVGGGAQHHVGFRRSGNAAHGGHNFGLSGLPYVGLIWCRPRSPRSSPA